MTISSSSERKWKKNQPWCFFLGVGSAQLSSSGVVSGLEGAVSTFSVGSGTGVRSGVAAGVAAGRSVVERSAHWSREILPRIGGPESHSHCSDYETICEPVSPGPALA